MKRIWITMICLALYTMPGLAQELKDMSLPAPRTTGGKPLMDALKERQTGRDFSEKTLDLQQISDLLWAAFGINRPESGKRTAPSAMNWQEIRIYVSMKEGTYLYDAVNNKLIAVLEGDQRSNMGRQSFTKEAAIVLTYVADQSKYIDIMAKSDKEFYSGLNAGYISQNVYLYCASTGLSTVAQGYIDRDQIARTLKLGKSDKVVISQSVGYPVE